MAKDTPKTTGAEDLDAFAHNMSEVLRIARTSDFFNARFYNGLAGAWLEFLHDGSLTAFHESEEGIRAFLSVRERGVK